MRGAGGQSWGRGGLLLSKGCRGFNKREKQLISLLPTRRRCRSWNRTADSKWTIESAAPSALDGMRFSSLARLAPEDVEGGPQSSPNPFSSSHHATPIDLNAHLHPQASESSAACSFVEPKPDWPSKPVPAGPSPLFNPPAGATSESNRLLRAKSIVFSGVEALVFALHQRGLFVEL